VTYTLHNGDCLDVLPTLEAQSVDAVICDPPYGTTACKWDSVIPFASMWAEIRRVLKPRGACVLFGSQPFTSALVMSNPGWFRYEWVWDKALAASALNAPYQPLKTHETITVFSAAASTHSPRGTMRYNPQKTPGAPYRKPQPSRTVKQIYRSEVRMYTKINETGDRYPTSVLRITGAARNKAHPTQKPLALLEYLVRTYTDPGDLVLDFTMGSGTTGHACMNLGRSFVGIERDPAYFAIAEQRIADAADPLRHMEAA
jgi:DNA modification methylase